MAVVVELEGSSVVVDVSVIVDAVLVLFLNVVNEVDSAVLLLDEVALTMTVSELSLKKCNKKEIHYSVSMFNFSDLLILLIRIEAAQIIVGVVYIRIEVLILDHYQS